MDVLKDYWVYMFGAAVLVSVTNLPEEADVTFTNVDSGSNAFTVATNFASNTNMVPYVEMAAFSNAFIDYTNLGIGVFTNALGLAGAVDATNGVIQSNTSLISLHVYALNESADDWHLPGSVTPVAMGPLGGTMMDLPSTTFRWSFILGASTVTWVRGFLAALVAMETVFLIFRRLQATVNS